MEVKIDSEEINKYVANSVLESAIGEQVKKAIDLVLEDLEVNLYAHNKRDNPIYMTVLSLVNKEIESAILGSHRKQIQKMVATKINEEFTNDMFEKLFDAWRRAVLR